MPQLKKTDTLEHRWLRALTPQLHKKDGKNGKNHYQR
jgi:hypothetical protein